VTTANGKRRAVDPPGVSIRQKLKNEIIKDEYNHNDVNNAAGDDYCVSDIFLF
jgi:hypothetical protein